MPQIPRLTRWLGVAGVSLLLLFSLVVVAGRVSAAFGARWTDTGLATSSLGTAFRSISSGGCNMGPTCPMFGGGAPSSGSSQGSTDSGSPDVKRFGCH